VSTLVTWLILQSKLPVEPSARRVYIWRKLKRLGAVYHQDSVWVLPNTAYTREQFRWLAAEIIEMGGEATLWESSLLQGISEDALIRQFQEQVNPGYQEILDLLQSKADNLDSLSRQYQQIILKDYFHSELGQRVRKAILARRGDER
jgi:hypothetical protein